jgi:hypothetical protein
MTNATANRKGRRLDGTPGKVFSTKLVEKHDDGTGTYETVFNDDDGVRQTKTERITLKKRGGGGRGLDLTPNREFTAIKESDNEDGTAVYVIPYNDENGVRHERREVREKGQRGGHRQPDATPAKVISGIKTERIASEDGNAGNDMILTVPFNDKNGNRLDGFVVLTVNSKGGLSSKVVENKPAVHTRQRKAENAENAGEPVITEDNVLETVTE